MRLSYKFLSVSLLISIIIGILVCKYVELYNIKGFEEALDGVLLFASISMGFYGACISIIASIFNTKVVKEIMEDPDDKKEFVIIVISTLIVGFLTVITTIVYQVFLKNGEIPINWLEVINLIWPILVSMFVAVNVIFILISFLIFFNNKDEDSEITKENSVYTPKLKRK